MQERPGLHSSSTYLAAQGSGFRVRRGLGFRVSGLGFRVRRGLGFRVSGLGVA